MNVKQTKKKFVLHRFGKNAMLNVLFCLFCLFVFVCLENTQCRISCFKVFLTHLFWFFLFCYVLFCSCFYCLLFYFCFCSCFFFFATLQPIFNCFSLLMRQKWVHMFMPTVCERNHFFCLIGYISYSTLLTNNPTNYLFSLMSYKQTCSLKLIQYWIIASQ